MRVDRVEAILEQDPRYPREAYEFMFDALNFTQLRIAQRLGERASAVQRHVSARELCEGACQFALEEFGLLAPTVLGQWNVTTTADLGNLVYNLIAAGEMSQSEEDRPEDFHDLFDLPTMLKEGFMLVLEEE